VRRVLKLICVGQIRPEGYLKCAADYAIVLVAMLRYVCVFQVVANAVGQFWHCSMPLIHPHSRSSSDSTWLGPAILPACRETSHQMSATSNANLLPVVSNCISLSWQILQLPWTSKSNKHEHKSLQSALTNIRSFLQAVPSDGVSREGRDAYSKWEAVADAGGDCCSCSW
jgi:hypothetical protein